MRDKFINKSHNALSFSLCLDSKGKEHYDQCLEHRTKECVSAKVRVIKTIRLTLKAVWKLLTLNPDVKVIWYLRDPRPSMLSKLSLDPHINLTQAAWDRCSRMDSDLLEYGALKKAYPQHVMQLRYEDLAMEPLDMARVVYGFVGRDMPGNLPAWIRANTQAHAPDQEYGTKRNSTQTVNKWRTVIKPEQKAAIEAVCHHVLHQLRYD